MFLSIVVPSGPLSHGTHTQQKNSVQTRKFNVDVVFCHHDSFPIVAIVSFSFQGHARQSMVVVVQKIGSFDV